MLLHNLEMLEEAADTKKGAQTNSLIGSGDPILEA
jgi:hypothetical protein